MKNDSHAVIDFVNHYLPNYLDYQFYFWFIIILYASIEIIDSLR
jgi:hypothetical protein